MLPPEKPMHDNARPQASSWPVSVLLWSGVLFGMAWAFWVSARCFIFLWHASALGTTKEQTKSSSWNRSN